MPIICTFRGIKIYINYSDHMPPHFHAYYGEYECCIDINEIEKINGDMPNKQLNFRYRLFDVAVYKDTGTLSIYNISLQRSI